MKRLLLLVLALMGAPAGAAIPAEPQVAERSVAEIQADMDAGRLSAEALVRAYLSRISQIDRAGPTLRSIIALNPRAIDDARELDRERASGRVRGPLHGIPILIKDNIETADALATTMGSLALAGNVTRRDAPLVARLRAAGAVILGKTNLSEWTNIRSAFSTSGWSALGGLVRNPYALDRNACGSSSGSAVAVSSSLAAVSVGTETQGSIICPAAMNGVVGFKPTVGLVSRRYLIPISPTQDTAGPIGRTVADVAALLTAMAGSDLQDPVTRQSDARRVDYSRALSPDALRGRRLGILRSTMGYQPALDAVFDEAVATLRAAGAEVVEIAAYTMPPELGGYENLLLLTEFKAAVNAYLAGTPVAVTTRSLEQVIDFNRAHPREEMPMFGQDLLETAQGMQGLDDPVYIHARQEALRLAGPEGIDKLLRDNRLDAIIAPTASSAWQTDTVLGDNYVGSTGTLSAIAGYPHLTVPMGQVRGMPVGLSFMGAAWSDADLLAFGYAFEVRAAGRQPPTYRATVSDIAADPVAQPGRASSR